ncbi:MAG: mechanosensitive ion channel family protein [Acidobacteria bacterium]|nr:mechanosensitive ion channel family protein [Acidobacteriota bacterium]
MLLALQLSKKVISRRLVVLAKRTVTGLDDQLAKLIAKTRFFFFLALSVYAGSLALALPERWVSVVQGLAILALLLQAGVWGNCLISYLISHYVRLEAGEEALQATSEAALVFFAKLVLWSLVLLLALDNMGIDTTALITSLGIGGIAIALAVQNILGDLFASLSIMIDRPFVVGDFIIVDEYLGSVEHIGIKSTRVRSLHGEQLIFSNADLLKSRIRNFKQMSERRVIFSIGVTYETPYEKLAAISSMIREIVESREAVRFDRAHFKGYGDSSLNFEVVYWIKSPDYNLYMDIQERINLEIFSRFAREGIEFAYPTRTLHLRAAPPAVESLPERKG